MNILAGRWWTPAARVLEILIFSALILTARCANFRDVFVAGEIYFTDADCYSRMTRARICLEHPGTIIRHHSFENFPAGTTPHTTAPLDYLIVGLATILQPLSAKALDLAGAVVSPLLGLLGGWFLWWWAIRNKIRYRGALLLLYATSPILAHGTELGRPDHQSLLIFLLLVAVCSEWTLQSVISTKLSAVNGVAWGSALWVSLYEPLVLLLLVVVSHAISARENFTARHRRIGWVLLGVIVVIALAIEQRVVLWPVAGGEPVLANWSRTIGELKSIPLNDTIWLRWTGLLIVPAPALLWIAFRKRFVVPFFMVALLIATFFLTAWQARWAYFFVAIFALMLPALLGVIEHRAVAWVAIIVSMLPIMKYWDETIWPNEQQTALRAEHRLEATQWRNAAQRIAAPEEAPFLAPWWFSPAVAYWSGQPGIAGSSHEAIDGIARSARFFLASDAETAREILLRSRVKWVLAYDADRIVANSAALLGVETPANPLGGVLDRAPSQAPAFFELVSQNGACKLFRTRFSEEKHDFPR